MERGLQAGSWGGCGRPGWGPSFSSLTARPGTSGSTPRSKMEERRTRSCRVPSRGVDSQIVAYLLKLPSQTADRYGEGSRKGPERVSAHYASCPSWPHLSPSVDGRGQWGNAGFGAKSQAAPSRLRRNGRGAIGDEDGQKNSSFFARGIRTSTPFPKLVRKFPFGLLSRSTCAQVLPLVWRAKLLTRVDDRDSVRTEGWSRDFGGAPDGLRRTIFPPALPAPPRAFQRGE